MVELKLVVKLFGSSSFSVGTWFVQSSEFSGQFRSSFRPIFIGPALSPVASFVISRTRGIVCVLYHVSVFRSPITDLVYRGMYRLSPLWFLEVILDIQISKWRFVRRSTVIGPMLLLKRQGLYLPLSYPPLLHCLLLVFPPTNYAGDSYIPSQQGLSVSNINLKSSFKLGDLSFLLINPVK